MKDRGFASPTVEEWDAAAKKKKEEIDREIELVEKEYEEKLSKKRNKSKDEGKDVEDTDKNKKGDKAKNDEGDAKTTKEKDDKVGTFVEVFAMLSSSAER